jgi:hypothetical protein
MIRSSSLQLLDGFDGIASDVQAFAESSDERVPLCC